MAIRTASEYWSIVGKSKFFDAEVLDKLKQRFDEVEDAPKLARKLIDCGELTDWQARYLLSGRHHLHVGQYVLLERLTTPAVGDRFLAIHKNLDRKVEVNLFPGSLADDNELFAEFLEKASRVAKLDHRNLVHLYDIDQENGRYYFVFEHDDGVPLDRISRGQLDARAIAVVTRQLLDGLDHAHSAGLIHGQLDESQVRLDKKNHVRISNMGLASMMDQLRHEGTATDVFAVQPVAADDAVSIGKMTRNLFDEQVGKPTDSRQELLVTLLDDLSRMVDGTPGSAAEFRKKIEEWIKLDDAAEAAVRAAPVTQSAIPDQPGARSAAKPAGAKPPAPEPAPDTSASKRASIIAGGLTVAVLLALAWWMWGSRDDNGSKADLSSAKSLDEVTSGVTTESGGQVFGTDAINPPRGHTDEAKPDAPDQKSPLDKALEAATSGTGSSDDARTEPDAADTPTQPVQLEPDDDNTLPEPGQGLPAETESGEAASSMDLATAIAGAPSRQLFEGQPLINWQDAADYENETVAVFGKIVDSGKTRAGTIHFLNFEKGNSKAFTVVVREKYLKEFSGDLVDLFLNQEVVVTGLVTMYRGNTPQIEVESGDQIRLANTADLANRSAASATEAGSDVSDTREPFRDLPAALDIPVWSRDEPVERRVVGQIHSGDDLLGLEFTGPPGFSPRGEVFSIIRDPANVNRWEVRFAARSADPPQPVAEFIKSGTELSFAWLADSPLSSNVNFLRNGLLRIASPDSSRVCQLRTAVELEPVVLTSKRPNYRENILIPDLPDEGFIKVELQKFPKSVFADQNTEVGYKMSAGQPSTEIFFNRDALQRILAINFEVRFGTRLRFESGLMVNSPEGFLPYRDSTFSGLGETLRALQARISAEKLAADKFEAPYGQKTSHKNYVKELSKRLDLINLQVESCNAATERLKNILDRPIQFRVIYEAEDSVIELARTSGWTAGAEALAAEDSVQGDED